MTGLPLPDAHGGADKDQAYATLAGSLAAGALVLCDHASNALPACYGSLGLPGSELQRHIAWDIGAAGVAAHLAAALAAPAVFTCHSRLLIDCNRGLDDPTLIMQLSDGAIVPGNRILTQSERAHRIEQFFTPYHSEIRRLIDAAVAADEPPVLISVHSYTPRWKGTMRPWHCGILWDKDPRLASVLLSGLKQDRDLVVGDNQPYSGHLKGDCLWQHGTQRGLAHAIIEIRQDLIEHPDGQRAWANRVADLLKPALAKADTRRHLQKIEFHGSHTD
jgi:predicted N-formylglutamate amidohydrolase